MDTILSKKGYKRREKEKIVDEWEFVWSHWDEDVENIDILYVQVNPVKYHVFK